MSLINIMSLIIFFDHATAILTFAVKCGPGKNVFPVAAEKVAALSSRSLHCLFLVAKLVSCLFSLGGLTSG